MKNIIISYSTNTSWDNVFRFVVSSRQACSPDEVDVVLFTDVAEGELARAAIHYNVTLVPVVNVWKYARNSKFLNLYYHASIAWTRTMMNMGPSAQRPWLHKAHRHLVAGWIHPLAGRWIAYLDYLRINSAYYLVMTADSRDLIFQADPFNGLDPEFLHTFEGGRRTFGDEPWNTESYCRVYGKRNLERINGRRPLCAGTVIAGTSVFLQFLELLVSEMVRYPRQPLDQAIFNEVLYNQFDPARVKQYDGDSGPVVTLSGLSPIEWEIRDQMITRKEGPIPVVHMYDRNPRAWELITSKFPSRPQL